MTAITPNMRRRSPKRIHSLAQLEDTLGDQFVILCGSAISGRRLVNGKRTPFLPLVDDVKRAFLTGVSSVLHTGDHYDKTLAACADALVSGDYSEVRSAMKFEEFLGKIELALGSKRQVSALLAALFYCDGLEYCANHSAVGELIRAGRISACLTTNFDNALELAGPPFTKYVYPQHPDDVATPRSLVKLHGDVETGDYVATVDALMRDRLRRQHAYLIDLLQGKTVLVAGYSGTGDVDIAPHLQASDATLVWLVRGKHKTPTFTFASHFMGCDLSAENEAENVLIGLARSRRAIVHDAGLQPPWQDRLAAWIASLPRDALRDCIVSLIRDSLGWPVLHLYHMYHMLDWSGQTSDETIDGTLAAQHGAACLGIAAYYSAERAFQAALQQRPDDLPSRAQLGYTYWRLGYYEKALAVFRPLLDSTSDPKPWVSRKPGSFASEGFLAQPVATACRMYLETARDALRLHVRQSARRQLSDRWRLQEVISLLEQMGEDEIDARARLLSDLVRLDIHRLIGTNVTPSSVAQIFQQCFDLQLWTPAAAAAGVWASIDLLGGLRATMQVGRVLAKQGNVNYLGKLLASTLYALLPIKLPLIIEVLDGPLSMRPKAGFVEFLYWRRRRRWRAAYPRMVLVE